MPIISEWTDLTLFGKWLMVISLLAIAIICIWGNTHDDGQPPSDAQGT